MSLCLAVELWGAGLFCLATDNGWLAVAFGALGAGFCMLAARIVRNAPDACFASPPRADVGFAEVSRGQ